MEQLRDALRDYSDQYLIEQYQNHREEYTPEALELLGEEIKVRNIDVNEESTVEQGAVRKEVNMDSDDFVQFEHAFTNIDILLTATMLRDKGILFYIDNPEFSDVIPLESEASKRYTIHVHKDSVEGAHAVIDEHFDKSEGMYSLETLRCKGTP